MGEWLGVFLFVAPIALGFFVGRWRESVHLRSLDEREGELADMVVNNLKQIPAPEQVRQAELVSGDAVISSDYFKTIASQLRNLIGGEMKAFEGLMSRARREARVRMLQQARDLGAREVYNVRYETSNIASASNNRNKAMVAVEVFAFGTAVVRGADGGGGAASV
jgi:uncharacterized protein YbjQ (UPF0145 family)